MTMSNSNTGFMFHKAYFSGYEWPSSQKDQRAFFEGHGRVNSQITDRKLGKADIIPNPDAPQTLSMWTTYPGLIIGSGYPHGTGGEGEFKIGFHFEYASGMPVLPGSSIKGILRSAFPDWKRDKTTAPEIKQNKARLIWFLLKGEEKEILTDIEENFITELEELIFEGKHNNERMSIYNCDTFFDAVVVKGDDDRAIFGKDFITPHKHKSNPLLDPFSNPNPLMFLKVLPYVKWEFRFRLKDSVLSDGQTIDVAAKLSLFEKILSVLGIGAKTNVGYGQLINQTEYSSLFGSKGEKASYQDKKVHVRKDPPISSEVPKNDIPQDCVKKLVRNSTFKGTVINVSHGYNVVRISVGRGECQLVRKSEKNPGLKVGDAILVRFLGDYRIDNPNFTFETP